MIKVFHLAPVHVVCFAAMDSTLIGNELIDFIITIGRNEELLLKSLIPKKKLKIQDHEVIVFAMRMYQIWKF